MAKAVRQGPAGEPEFIKLAVHGGCGRLHNTYDHRIGELCTSLPTAVSHRVKLSLFGAPQAHERKEVNSTQQTIGTFCLMHAFARFFA